MTEQATIGDNNGPVLDPFDDIQSVIEDLFTTAKDFCDGEAVASQQMHDAIEKIHDDLQTARKEADGLRKVEKKPHDDAAKKVQDKYKPLLSKADLGKKACQDLLTPWRAKVAAEKAAAAERAAKAAEEAAAKATAAIQESSGDLSARVIAEEQLAHAKSLEKGAKRANKDATTGTGLRTVWETEISDVSAALDWAYTKDPAEFNEIALRMARAEVKSGTRNIPGFNITETKVAN